MVTPCSPVFCNSHFLIPNVDSLAPCNVTGIYKYTLICVTIVTLSSSRQVSEHVT